jgi:hypothetical protein
MPNIFESTSEDLRQVQLEAVTDSGNQAAGTITFAGKVIPAFVGPFSIQQFLTPGGFRPSLAGTVIVNKSDLPSDTPLHSGNLLTATPPIGVTRNCQIMDFEDCYSFWKITVIDQSQNA